MAKIALQDFIKYGKLFDVYGKLLSADRQRIMSAYFEYNMTLAEIAKEKNISRQAVLDAIDKACQKLDEYEVALKLQGFRGARKIGMLRKRRAPGNMIEHSRRHGIVAPGFLIL